MLYGLANDKKKVQIDCCWVINPTQNYITLPVIWINFIMIDNIWSDKSFGNLC